LIIDPLNFEGFNRIFTGVIVPRPIAFVSSMSADGYVNLAPYSFFNAELLPSKLSLPRADTPRHIIV